MTTLKVDPSNGIGQAVIGVGDVAKAIVHTDRSEAEEKKGTPSYPEDKNSRR